MTGTIVLGYPLSWPGMAAGLKRARQTASSIVNRWNWLPFISTGYLEYLLPAWSFLSITIWRDGSSFGLSHKTRFFSRNLQSPGSRCLIWPSLLDDFDYHAGLKLISPSRAPRHSPQLFCFIGPPKMSNATRACRLQALSRGGACPSTYSQLFLAGYAQMLGSPGVHAHHTSLRAVDGRFSCLISAWWFLQGDLPLTASCATRGSFDPRNCKLPAWDSGCGLYVANFNPPERQVMSPLLFTWTALSSPALSRPTRASQHKPKTLTPSPVRGVAFS